MIETGRHVLIEDILALQNRRDLEDRMRPVGRLRPAPDAVLVQSDGMTPEQVFAKVLSIILERKESLVADLT